MGQAIDATGIQFKVLNRSRGPAVWCPRAQADKKAYRNWMRTTLETQAGIQWVIGAAAAVLVEGGRVIGLRLEDGRVVRSHQEQSVPLSRDARLKPIISIRPGNTTGPRIEGKRKA